MSSLACKNCKSVAVEYEDYCGGTSYFRCKTCGMRGNKDKFTPVTLFDRIAQSPEVLAEKLVYKTESIFEFGQTVIVRWYSTIVDGIFETKTEAITATVARLKEVCDEGIR